MYGYDTGWMLKMYRALGKRVPHYRNTKSALEMILTQLHYYNVRLRIINA
jgi:hypothetical protein